MGLPNLYVVKDGSKFVCNPDADVAKEVLGYLNAEHGYGNKESRTGKGWSIGLAGLATAGTATCSG